VTNIVQKDIRIFFKSISFVKKIHKRDYWDHRLVQSGGITRASYPDGSRRTAHDAGRCYYVRSKCAAVGAAMLLCSPL